MDRIAERSALGKMDEKARGHLADIAGWNVEKARKIFSAPANIHAYIPDKVLDMVLGSPEAPKALRVYCACQTALRPIFDNASSISDRLAAIVIAHSESTIPHVAMRHPYGYVKCMSKNVNLDDNGRMRLVEIGLYMTGCHAEKLVIPYTDGKSLYGKMKDMHSLCMSIIVEMKDPSETDRIMAKYFMECVRALHFVSEMGI